MAAKKSDPRGPVAVVSSSSYTEGPFVWFPHTFGTPERRMVKALRSAVSIVQEFGHRPHAVFVQERGEWVPA